jgi:hypothetical protein
MDEGDSGAADFFSAAGHSAAPMGPVFESSGAFLLALRPRAAPRSGARPWSGAAWAQLNGVSNPSM